MLLGKSDPRLIVSTLPTPVGAGEGASAGVVHRQAPPRAAEKIAGMSMAQLNAERLARERERDEMRRLESSAEDEKNRLESSAEWLDRPISKKKNKEKSGGGGGGGGGGGAADASGPAARTKPAKDSRAGADKDEAREGEEEDVEALLKRLDLDRGINNCGFPKCEAEGVHMIGTTCVHCRLRSAHLYWI